MENIDFNEKIDEKDSFGFYYAIYFPKKKEYIIVQDCSEADNYRKGNYNLTQKFVTREEAVNWAENCKIENFVELNSKKFYGIFFRDTKETMLLTSPEKVNIALYKRSALCRKFTLEEKAIKWLEKVREQETDIILEVFKEKKKKYYAIYFIEQEDGIIITSSIEVATTVKNKPYYCRKFASEDMAKRWLKVVKKTNKNIDPLEIVKYENISNPKILNEKFYGVYLIEEEEAFVTNSLEEANLAIKDKEGLIKKFKKEKDARNWVIQCKNDKRVYYGVFFPDELDSLIIFNYEKLKTITKDKSNIYKVFGTIFEADKWLRNMEYYYTEEMEKLLKEDTIFFDVGTGRGIGEEVRVSDFAGNSILNKLEEYNGLINEYGNYNLGKINNTSYGELYGLYLALLIALENNIYKIAGDNQTVINQWSKGEVVETKVLPSELELIKKVIKLREEFEAKGGEVCYINASLNPADLGFHKSRRKVKIKEETNNS